MLNVGDDAWLIMVELRASLQARQRKLEYVRIKSMRVEGCK